MQETSRYNETIKSMLETFGIKYTSQVIDGKEFITCDRTSMLNVAGTRR